MPVEILKSMGLTRVRLMSNNPEKIAALEKAGIQVVERVPAVVQPVKSTETYLRTKRDRLGHLL
jgi:GTP cyclohydrolase II